MRVNQGKYMSANLIIGIIAAAILAGAFGYLGFHSEYNASIRQRQLNKVRERIRKLDNIIVGLPVNYFPKTLKALVYASIADSLEQSAKLSGDRAQAEQVKRVRAQLKKMQKVTAEEHSPALTLDTHSLREYKHLLKDLRALIKEFHKEGMLSHREAESHLTVIKDVILGVSVDFYCEAARHAAEGDNKSLALHYYSMAKGQLDSTDSDTIGTERAPMIAAQISVLTEELESKKAQQQQSGTLPDASVLAEWEAMDQEEEKWRKSYY